MMTGVLKFGLLFSPHPKKPPKPLKHGDDELFIPAGSLSSHFPVMVDPTTRYLGEPLGLYTSRILAQNPFHNEEQCRKYTPR
ncbi:hypothetical protein ACFLTP_04360 [Chloroflexota bacterium]